MARIPVHRNAPLIAPDTSERWPVMIFSHGLGGSRNAYSHICGLIASHGVCVVTADHRDSSAPISFIRATSGTPEKMVNYQRYSHTPSPEVYQGRDAQLRIRLWELGLIHDAIVKIDKGGCPENLDPNYSSKDKSTEVLGMFKNLLHVHDPGSITWAGHSFGATSMIQLIKSTYYTPPEPKGEFDESLFTPDRSSSIVKQITSSSVTLLLDLWCLPLRSRSTRWLWEKPMPCYDVSEDCAGGKALLAVESEAFFKWEGNLNDTKRILSPKEPSPSNALRWEPYFFYPSASAHLSQSDFSIMFPWITGRVLKAKEPERILRLNARAMLQVLRNNGYNISPPTSRELDESNTVGARADSPEREKPKKLQDHDILSNVSDKMQDWHVIPLDGFVAASKSVDQDYKTPSAELDEGQVLDFYEGRDNSATPSPDSQKQTV
jgi:platelet-activating factor acetylhydrolase